MATRGTPGPALDTLMCELGLPADIDNTLVTGPAAPLPFVPAPANELPTWTPDGAAAVWWVGCHGGAGESTLAALAPGSGAANHRWPKLPDRPAPVVLLARTSSAGLAAAQTALTQWASGNTPPVELLGLALSADAPGRLPRPLRDLAQLVGGGAPRVWRLPWIQPWRAGEPVSPRPVARLLQAVTTLLPSPTNASPAHASGASAAGTLEEGC